MYSEVQSALHEKLHEAYSYTVATKKEAGFNLYLTKNRQLVFLPIRHGAEMSLGEETYKEIALDWYQLKRAGIEKAHLALCFHTHPRSFRGACKPSYGDLMSSVNQVVMNCLASDNTFQVGDVSSISPRFLIADLKTNFCAYWFPEVDDQVTSFGMALLGIRREVESTMLAEASEVPPESLRETARQIASQAVHSKDGKDLLSVLEWRFWRQWLGFAPFSKRILDILNPFEIQQSPIIMP